VLKLVSEGGIGVLPPLSASSAGEARVKDKEKKIIN
jgi:hypothetical protein